MVQDWRALLVAIAIAALVFGAASLKRFLLRRLALAGTVARRPTQIGRAAVLNLLTFGLPGLIALVLLGRTEALIIMPDELRFLAWTWGLPAELGAYATTMLGCLALGAGIGALILTIRRRRELGPIGLRHRSPATVQAPGERLPAAALACAAGVGEELLFRLALPLAIAIGTGNMAIGVVVATALFGAGHRHQGWVGVVITALIGLSLTWFYFLTGRLWVPMILHVAINLNALILRPWLTRPLNSSAASPSGRST